MSVHEIFTLPINVNPNVTPDSPEHYQPIIGLIGMGSMGRMFMKYLSQAGWKRIYICDRPENYDKLKDEYDGTPGVFIQRDGYAVSRSSDFIMYSVEAEHIDKVVAQYGPSTKSNAIVAGQTSVKAPEKTAFETHLPKDVHILSCHSLHGPTVNPASQPMVIIRHKTTKDALTLVETIFRPLCSRFIYLSYEEHDQVTANTQALMHAAFLSMGSAWASAESYPWEQGLYVGGIETAKVNITLRIYSNAWHVYAGLAILNPCAHAQIHQYAKSASELFKLMLSGGRGSLEDQNQLKERIKWARRSVFGHWNGDKYPNKFEKEEMAERVDTMRIQESSRKPILLATSILDRFTLGAIPEPTLTLRGSPTSTSAHSPGKLIPSSNHRPNSHLSLLAMVDCWAHLNINPYKHLQLAATPIFRVFLGVAEHVFRSPTLLESTIHSAIHNHWYRSDDLEFVIAARDWSQCVSCGSFEVYQKRFEETKKFFEPQFDEARKLGNEMIEVIMESEAGREANPE